MSFCVSHVAALDKNIRHLYSGPPSDIRFRAYNQNKDGSLDLHDRVLQSYKRPPDRFEKKFQEYSPAYNARLPRAPAFRSVSPEEAKQISNRLSRPTIMSHIRHQSAVSRSTSRSTSRRGRSQMSMTENGEGSERHEDDSQATDSYRGQRRVSYKDWSDDESGVYYYDDEDKTDDNNTSCATPSTQNGNDKGYNEELSRKEEMSEEAESISASQDQESEANQVHHETPLNRSASPTEDQDRDSSDDSSKASSVKSDKNDSDSTNNANKTSHHQPRVRSAAKKQQPAANRGRMNFLEQIMKTKTNSRQRQTKSTPQTRESKRLQRRPQIDNRLGYSPYREPMPQLYFVYEPPAKSTSSTRKSRTNQTNKSHTMDAYKPAKPGYICRPSMAVYMSQNSRPRPQTRASSDSRRKEMISYQYHPEPRATLSQSPPARSKSATPFTGNPDKGREMSNNRNSRTKEAFVKSAKPFSRQSGSRSAGINSRASNAQSSTSGRAVSRGSNNTRSDLYSKQKEKDSTQSKQVNGLDHDSRDGEKQTFVRPDYETLRLMYSGEWRDNSNRRFASPREMEQVNNRLMRPTTVTVIRGRMRWAPNNDQNLADPVKVVHDVVDRKTKKSDKRGRIHEGYDTDDSVGEDETEVSEMHHARDNKADVAISREADDNESNVKDDEKGIRGKREGQHEQSSSRSSSASTHSNNNDNQNETAVSFDTDASARRLSRSSAGSRSPSLRSSRTTSRSNSSREGSVTPRNRSADSRRRSSLDSKGKSRENEHSYYSRNDYQITQSNDENYNASSVSHSKDTKVSKNDADNDNHDDAHNKTTVVESKENIARNNGHDIVDGHDDDVTDASHRSRGFSHEEDGESFDQVDHAKNDSDSREESQEAENDNKNEPKYSKNVDGRGHEYVDRFGRGDEDAHFTTSNNSRSHNHESITENGYGTYTRDEETTTNLVSYTVKGAHRAGGSDSSQSGSDSARSDSINSDRENSPPPVSYTVKKDSVCEEEDTEQDTTYTSNAEYTNDDNVNTSDNNVNIQDTTAEDDDGSSYHSSSGRNIRI